MKKFLIAKLSDPKLYEFALNVVFITTIVVLFYNLISPAAGVGAAIGAYYSELRSRIYK